MFQTAWNGLLIGLFFGFCRAFFVQFLAEEGMAAVFFPPNPADNDCADAQYDKDTGLQAVHFFHQPVGIACAVCTLINPSRHGNQCGQTVHQDEAQVGNLAADACGHENGGTQAGQETGDE